MLSLLVLALPVPDLAPENVERVVEGVRAVTRVKEALDTIAGVFCLCHQLPTARDCVLLARFHPDCHPHPHSLCYPRSCAF